MYFGTALLRTFVSLFIRHHGLYFFQKYFYVRLFESDWLWCQRHWLFDSQWLHWLLIPRTSGCALMSHVLECRQVLNAFVECVRWMLPQSLFIGLSQPLPFLRGVLISACVCVSCHSFPCLLSFHVGAFFLLVEWCSFWTAGLAGRQRN